MVLHAPGRPLVAELRSDPVPAAGELRVRVEACAIAHEVGEEFVVSCCDPSELVEPVEEALDPISLLAAWILGPPLTLPAPAACWRARTMVESIISHSRSASRANAASMSSRTPIAIQRW